MQVRRVGMMTSLFLVPSDRAGQQLWNGREGLPASPYEIEADLNAMGNGVPVTFDEPDRKKVNGNWSLLVHTQRYVLRLFLTGKYQSAYSIASVMPLRLRDHERLARGYLLVKPWGWRVREQITDLPQRTSAGWDRLWDEWCGLTSELAATAPPTRRQDDFLRMLDGVIDATERITAEQGNGDRYPYAQAMPTGGKRTGAAQLYDFRLAGARAPEERAFVQVVGGEGARGKVHKVSGMTVTVKFDDPVDWTEIAGQGELVETKSNVVYRMQRKAVDQLRSGQARNPGVLFALVDGQVRPASAPSTRRPEVSLNPHQEDAFHKALTTPELLIVLGPPGTGKTRTITEITRAATRSRERVIVCSQNNQAVDNVLGELPTDVLALRVGNEDRVTAQGQPFLLQRRADELKSAIVTKAKASLDAYRGLDQLTGWASELARRNAELAASREAQARAADALTAQRRAAGGPATEAVDRAEAAHAAAAGAAQRSVRRVRRLGSLRDWASARTAWLLIGWLLASLAARWDQKLTVELARGASIAEAVRASEADLEAARHHLTEVTRDVPAVRAAAAAADAATARAGRDYAAAAEAGRACRQAVLGMVEPASVPPDNAGGTDGDRQLAALSSWLGGLIPLLAPRRELLSAWLSDISGDAGQLHPELIRYADVVAATCTGAGSRPEIAGLDLDLAIIDEAGQITVADTLVPLVRTRRAVIVGDHKQLPPFLDNDVEAWGKGVGDPGVRDLLSKSALELVVDALPAEHPNVVQLTEQRRMPTVVAEFVSAQFYDKQLTTAGGTPFSDRLFRSPMAFVDTSGLDWPTRKDQSGRERERWGQKGFVNPTEADLLADLAARYARLGANWAVIVPYVAQAALITSRLTGRAGDAESVRANVGTVHSFQGGQRDVILYGFTRSNPERRVGFLSELRILNVAISRVKGQLVLVGDLDTLTRARNQGFRELARALREYVERNGEVVAYQAMRARLDGSDTPEGSR